MKGPREGGDGLAAFARVLIYGAEVMRRGGKGVIIASLICKLPGASWNHNPPTSTMPDRPSVRSINTATSTMMPKNQVNSVVMIRMGKLCLSARGLAITRLL